MVEYNDLAELLIRTGKTSQEPDIYPSRQYGFWDVEKGILWINDTNLFKIPVNSKGFPVLVEDGAYYIAPHFQSFITEDVYITDNGTLIIDGDVIPIDSPDNIRVEIPSIVDGRILYVKNNEKLKLDNLEIKGYGKIVVEGNNAELVIDKRLSLGIIRDIPFRRGNMIVGNGNEWAKIETTDNKKVLTVDSSQSIGIKYEYPIIINTQIVDLVSDRTTTSSTYSDITSSNISYTPIKGTLAVKVSLRLSVPSTETGTIRLVVNGSNGSKEQFLEEDTSMIVLSEVFENVPTGSPITIKTQFKNNANALTITALSDTKILYEIMDY